MQSSEKLGILKCLIKTAGKLHQGAKNAGEIGQWLSKFATGQNAGTGWKAIFKLGTYSGSDAHKTVLQVGKFFGHKFKPWEAVKTASKIGKFGKVLGVGGALLSVGLQIWDDYQEGQIEKQLIACRSDVRNTFSEAANVIDLHFDEQTQTWVEENITPSIKSIDEQIREIEDSVKCKEQEFSVYHKLLIDTRELISCIQKGV